MRKLHWEIILIVLFIAGGTILVSSLLLTIPEFWTAQKIWSLALITCWIAVAVGYWRQGALIHKAKSATHVSLLLPCVVFAAQCILFIKGVYYHDLGLIIGAVLVNSAVVFDLSQIFRYQK